MNHHNNIIKGRNGLTALMLLSCTTSIAQKSPQPNVVLFIADDISATDLGCYGNPVVHTPNIDSLAERGLRFERMYLSISSSSPSRSSIITGRYPHNTGACELHTVMSSEQVFFPELLRHHGYYTAQSGKWHFGDKNGHFSGPVLRAFDHVGGDEAHGGGASGALQWLPTLKGRDKSKPFFMWFASHDAHRGWDQHIFLPRYNKDSVDVYPWYYDDDRTRTDVANYYNEVSRFDYYVGQVVQELRSEGILDNTVIIVMADNGRPFPRAKTTCLTQGLQTPFIVCCPSWMHQQKSSICNSLVSSLDIAPTILDLCGIKPGRTFQGRSFAKLLSHPQKTFRHYAFAEHNWHSFEAYERAVYSDSLLLIVNGRTNLNAVGATDIMNGGTGKSLREHRTELDSLQGDIFRNQRPEVLLYNYRTDPLEMKDLSSSHPAEVKRLFGVLRQWQKDTGDTCPDHLTPDWSDRTTIKALPWKGQRGEMPGSSRDAKHCMNAGPF